MPQPLAVRLAAARNAAATQYAELDAERASLADAVEIARLAATEAATKLFAIDAQIAATPAPLALPQAVDLLELGGLYLLDMLGLGGCDTSTLQGCNGKPAEDCITARALTALTGRPVTCYRTHAFHPGFGEQSKVSFGPVVKAILDASDRGELPKAIQNPDMYADLATDL